MSELTRLGKNAEAALDTQPGYDATTMRPQHIDSKRWCELQEKRVALGHREDDHEDEQNNRYQQQM